MSKESLAKFWKQVETDVELQHELDGLFQASGDQKVAAGGAIVEVASRRGFLFTNDELKADLATSRGGAELSDTELEGVAGGAAVDFYLKIDGIIGESDSGLSRFRRGRLVLF